MSMVLLFGGVAVALTALAFGLHRRFGALPTGSGQAQ